MKMQTCFKIEDSVWLEFRAMCKKHGYRPAELVGAFMIGWIPAYGGRGGSGEWRRMWRRGA